MDKQLEKRLNDDFIPHDLKLRNQKKNTKVLIFDKDTEYARLNKKVYDAIIIEKKLFDVSNEIMCYSTNKVAILMYNKKEKF
jgi:DNA polymerase IIIc chi subunit